MKLRELATVKKPVELKVYDFFVAKTSIDGIFALRQVVRTKGGYGILRVGDGRLFANNSKSIDEALQGYDNIQEVKLEEVSYRTV